MKIHVTFYKTAYRKEINAVFNTSTIITTLWVIFWLKLRKADRIVLYKVINK